MLASKCTRKVRQVKIQTKIYALRDHIIYMLREETLIAY